MWSFQLTAFSLGIFNLWQPKKPRISLTKAQITSSVGAELLVLCQSITEDGSLSKVEILALRKWLKTNRSSDLPAINFLATTIERIIADGIVTKEESSELYKAIETILPPEARREAKDQRKLVEAEEKAKDREKLQQSRPLQSLNFMVAGVHYEGRPDVIEEHVNAGDTVFLAREPQNIYSRNAIEIRLRNGMVIGYVPEDYAVNVAPLIDQGCPHTAFIIKILTGGRVPIPIVQAYLYRTDTTVKNPVFTSDVPQKKLHFIVKPSNSARKSGCLSVALTAAIFVTFKILWTLMS